MIPYSVVLYLIAFLVNFCSIIYLELDHPFAQKVSLVEIAIGLLMCGLPFVNIAIATIHIIGAFYLLIKKME